MLVLSRRVGEELVLPGVQVRFTVLSVSGGQIRIGIEAPAAVRILRGELDAPDTQAGGHSTRASSGGRRPRRTCIGESAAP